MRTFTNPGLSKEFVIYDLQSHHEIHIMSEDRQEFRQLIAVLSDEIRQEGRCYQK